MRKTLLLTTCVMISTSVWAFGGIVDGITGHKSHHSGVSSIGVHIDANGGNETPNITLANCDAYAGTGLVDNETYNGGYAGLASDNQTQCRCPVGTKWNDGACIASEGASCTSWTTNECGTGYYCQFSPENGDDDPTEGVCKDVEYCGLYPLGDTGFIGSEHQDEFCRPDWWTAQSICASKNMKLVSLADVGCENYINEICPTEGTIFGDLINAGLRYHILTTDLLDNMFLYVHWDYEDHGDPEYVWQDYKNELYDFVCKQPTP